MHSHSLGDKDFIMPDSNITFPPSDSAATSLVVTVTVVDDDVVESIEFMQVIASFGEPKVSSNRLIIAIEDNGDSMLTCTSYNRPNVGPTIVIQFILCENWITIVGDKFMGLICVCASYIIIVIGTTKQ